MSDDPLKKLGMHAGAENLIFANAEKNRNKLTYEEDILWRYLQTKPNGQKWRRQHPFGSYILDFYCHKIRLSVELDGANHLEEEGIEYDQERTKFINAMGVKELRFTNNRIKSDFDTVINSIMETSL